MKANINIIAKDLDVSRIEKIPTYNKDHMIGRHMTKDQAFNQDLGSSKNRSEDHKQSQKKC